MKQLSLLVVVVAACGKVQDVPIDADVGVPDAPPPPPVKVTVLTYAGDGAPDVAAKMVFQDPMGRIVFEGPVDAMGKLEAAFPTGGSVTEVRIVTDTANQLRAEITTIMGVEPGDDLTFGFKPRPTIVNQGGQTSMSANYTPVTGATSHVFFTTCGTSSGGTTSPVTLTFRDSCHGPTFDLVGVASGGTLTPPRFVRVTNINHQNGQSFAIPGGFSTMSNFTVNALNVPAEISSMTVSRSSMLEHAAVATQSVAVGDPPAGTVSRIVPYPATVGTRSEVSVSVSRPDAPGSQQANLHTATLTNSVDVDFARQQLPWLTGVTGTTTGATWTTAVPGGTPDGMLTIWAGRWVENGRTTIVGWRVSHPPSATGFTLPRLSPMHAAVDPQAQTVAVTPTGGTVFAVDFDNIDGYDGFRQQPDTLLTPSIDDMGAFLGMPYQRRLYTTSLAGQ